jgi:hypothetical protein
MRWILGMAALVGAVVWIGGRFTDGPMGFVSGGPLRAGELVSKRSVDWDFATSIPTLELQLVDPPRSRTLWLIVHGDQLYVPCGLPSFRLWKQWPHEAMEDGRAIIRIEAERYERRLERVTHDALWGALAERVAEKYGQGGDLDQDTLWFFRLASR